jgi:hypothetical protein
MAEVINLFRKSRSLGDNLICLKPLEFRRASWASSYFVQMLKSQPIRLESEHKEGIKIRHHEIEAIGSLPPHFVLKGGQFYIIRAMYACRENEEKMRDVYYLAGLIDCLINQVNPILRTDLLKAMYKKIFAMKKELDIHWYGRLDRVLLPIHSRYFDESEYRSSLKSADTMKDLYNAIRRGTDKMFRILSLEYVFYCPGPGGE